MNRGYLRMSMTRIVGYLMTVMLLSSQVSAQRVFSPGEDGIMLEIKEGPEIGKWGANRKANFPRLMETILQDACKIYLYSEEEIDTAEIFVSQVGDVHPLVGKPLFAINKKNFEIKKISDSIYEIALSYGFFRPLNTPSSNGTKWSDKIIVGFEPNKKHKKEGRQSKYWYANFSQLPYYPNEIGNWSEEQAIKSISQLIRGGKATERLFASIRPARQGDNIQYVIVQNGDPGNNPVASSVPNIASTTSKEEGEVESDVDVNIPYQDIKNENAFALIIANENYNRVASVPYARRDGKKISDYLNKTMGLDKGHIVFLENATLNDMKYELNRLSKISEAYRGDCTFIVYYCGHGIPDEKNGNGYLLPVDGYGTDVSTAYPLSELYSQLSNLKANKTVLFTDACFSGVGKEGDMLVAARGIAIKSSPNEPSGNLIAFSACQGDETAYSYKEKGHGLMTYYFLKKLQESKGKATLGELEEYIIDNVGKTSIVINGKPQTPTVSVSPELEMSWRDQTLF